MSGIADIENVFALIGGSGVELALDAQGRCTFTAQGGAGLSAARVYQTEPQVIPGAFVPTAVQFQAVAFDTSEYYHAGAPSRLTVPSAGLYLVGASVAMTGNDTLKGITIWRNGAAAYFGGQYAVGGNPSMSIALMLAAGDFVEVMADISVEQSTQVLDQITTFWAVRLGS